MFIIQECWYLSPPHILFNNLLSLRADHRTSIYLFIYGVFNNTATSSDYKTSNFGIIRTECSRKDVEGTGRSYISRPLCFLVQ